MWERHGDKFFSRASRRNAAPPSLDFISAKSIQDFWFPEISDYVFVLRHLVYGNLLEQQWEINTVNDWAITLQRQAETTLQTYRSPLHNVSKYSLKCIIYDFIYENMC